MSPLRCPTTGLTLRRSTITEAERITGPLRARVGSPFGRTEQVLLRSDEKAAYPVVRGVPILLGPEVLCSRAPVFDIRDSRWGEAYDEMDFYNESVASVIRSAATAASDLRAMRGHSIWSAGWIDATYDAASQLEALEHLGQPTEQTALQLGGKGIHAAKLLVAGVAEVWLLTPMLSEALYGLELAKELGASDRFHVAVGIAEQIPLADQTFDTGYAGGCLHHMSTHYAAPEIFRVLKPSGRFAAVEPWQTVLHKYGTRLVGKREANAYCRPLTPDRLAPMQEAFPDLDVRHHGPVLRYAALTAQKFSRRTMSATMGLRLTRVDDRLPLPRQLGGSVAVLATRHM